MKKLATLFLAALFLTGAGTTTASGEDCPRKVLDKKTVTGTLKEVLIEDMRDLPSDIIFLVDGKELRLVVENYELAEKLNKKNEKGRKFRIVYEKVYSWIGDSCNTFENLESATPVK